VKISEVRHMDQQAGGWKDGAHPEHGDYMSMADFADPDGNIWVVQEVGWDKR
jgi:hypothetical protein